MKGKLKKEVGITLISLVVTIIVLLILAGISINLTVGEHGIITNAKKAREEMIISQGKEKIEMGLSDISIGRIANGESCDLDYVSENIEGAIEGVKIEGIKGKPVLKIYLSYKRLYVQNNARLNSKIYRKYKYSRRARYRNNKRCN